MVSARDNGPVQTYPPYPQGYGNKRQPMATTYFNDLKESNAFLNLLLENINSAVIIVDEDLKIYQFNDFFLKLFDRATKRVVEKSFGNIAGCINAVRENKACGQTTQCGACILRRAIGQTMTQKVPADNIWLERIFYVDGRPVEKYLEITTRPITFQEREMTLVLIYDITANERRRIELQEKQQQIDRDLKAAAGIQQSLLPVRSPMIDQVQTAWKFEPCDMIGGDIFQILRPRQGYASLFMLDVCGHGVPAALISVAVYQFLQNVTDIPAGEAAPEPPAQVLQRLAREFPSDRLDDGFFSIIYMDIDLQRGVLRFANAGHPPPVLLCANGTRTILDQHGPCIGLELDVPPEQGEIELSPGDKIVLYTDGLLESRNAAGQLYGKHRFYQTLEAGHKPVDALVEAVFADMKRFRGAVKPDDDISLLALAYHPN